MHKLRRQGFTLLELLIVITLIAILGGMLMPVTQSIITRGYDTKCANNLRQIGMAANAAAADNDNTYPLIEFNGTDPGVGTAFGQNSKYMDEALKPYGITQEILICPLDAKDKKFYTDPMAHNSSYMWQPYPEDDSSVAPTIVRRGGKNGQTMVNQVNIPTSRLQLCGDWIPEHTPSNVSNPLGSRKMSYIVYADGHVRTGNARGQR